MRTTATPERTKPALLAAFVVLTVLALPTAAAAQEPNYTLRVTTDNGDAVVVLEDHSGSIAGLSGSVTFDSTILGQAECEMLVGLGACNDVGGELKFALLATSPLPVPVEVVRITFENNDLDEPQALRLTTVESATLQGEQLEGQLIDGSISDVDQGSTLLRGVLSAAGLVAAALIVGFVFRRSRDKNLGH